MNEELFEQAKRLATSNYTTIVSQDELSDGTVVFVARNPELRGCKASGETQESAISNLSDARVDFIYFLLEDGLDVPPPISRASITGIPKEDAVGVVRETFKFPDSTVVNDKGSQDSEDLFKFWSENDAIHQD